MLDFSSALYLGFRHPHGALGAWNSLTTGRPAALYEPPLIYTLEVALAELVGLERAVLSSSSLHLFWDFFGQLSAQKWVVFIDAEVYPIAQWGAERAASRGVRVERFPHHDAGALGRQLRQLRGRRPLVVTDGFCPLCGKGAPLGAYLEALRRCGGLLLLDDTQALGVLGRGPNPGQSYGYGGGGSLAYADVAGNDILLVASLAKGFGVPLAVLAGSEHNLRAFRGRSDTRVHCSPPSNAALLAVRRALDLNQHVGEHLRLGLESLVRYLRGRLGESGVRITGGLFPVQSLGSVHQVGAASLYRRLLRYGVRAVLQRGHNGSPQLSFLLNARHSRAELDDAVDTLSYVTKWSQPFFTSSRRLTMNGKSQSDTELERRRFRSTRPSAGRRRPRLKSRPYGHPRGCRCPTCTAPASEFVRWVQSSLNRALDLRLVTDGLMSPEVRSALRSFQRREGLPEDGVVNAATEAALRKAGAGGRGEEQELEFLGEVTVNRNSRDYIRWVQTSLNKVIGTRLALDGISGSQTRAAVRSFQQQKGLGVDGVVGPITEAALIAVGAGRPPGSLPAPYVPPVITPTQPGQIGARAAQIAVQEWQRWGQGRIKEADPSIRAVLEDYWRTGVGYVPSQPNWWSNVAWSAAFISWVMRQAGAGSAFRYSSAHTDYVAEAKRNRLANNSNPFKAYRVGELAPRVGDLVCVERQDAGGNWSGVTYDNVDQGFRASHCDIVTQVQPGSVTVIGGNVSDSVDDKPVPTDAAGRISAPRYYAVVRVT